MIRQFTPFHDLSDPYSDIEEIFQNYIKNQYQQEESKYDRYFKYCQKLFNIVDRNPQKKVSNYKQELQQQNNSDQYVDRKRQLFRDSKDINNCIEQEIGMNAEKYAVQKWESKYGSKYISYYGIQAVKQHLIAYNLVKKMRKKQFQKYLLQKNFIIQELPQKLLEKHFSGYYIQKKQTKSSQKRVIQKNKPISTTSIISCSDFELNKEKDELGLKMLHYGEGEYLQQNNSPPPEPFQQSSEYNSDISNYSIENKEIKGLSLQNISDSNNYINDNKNQSENHISFDQQDQYLPNSGFKMVAKIESCHSFQEETH